MKQYGKFFTWATCVMACACLTFFTACSDDDNDTKINPKMSLQELDKNIPGEYFDISYAEDGVLVNYLFNEDHSFNISFVYLDMDEDGWEYNMEEDYWYEVATGNRNSILNAPADSIDEYTEKELNAFDDVFIDEVEGTWRPYIGPLDGEQVTALIYDVKDAINGDVFSDTLQVGTQDGEIVLMADMSYVASMIEADATENEKILDSNHRSLKTRGFSGIFRKAFRKLVTVVRSVPDKIKKLGHEVGITLSGEARKNGKRMGNQQLGDWMSKVSDNTRLCKMSIPGTHDSWCYGDIKMSGWARTQSLNIEGQWNAGVRCFDVRINSNYMVVCHGPIKMKHSVESAFMTFQKLLAQHNKETVVLIISIDDGENANWRKLQIYNTFLSVFSGRTVQWKPDLTMGEARGKAVCIDRMGLVNCTDDSGKPLSYKGATANGWDTNKMSSRLNGSDKVEAFLWVQDDYCGDVYESTSGFISRKKNHFYENLMRMYRSPKEENLWAFNHESGYTGTVLTMSYPECSGMMAPYIEGLLKNSQFRGTPTGFVMMDYAGKNYGGGGYISYTCNLAEAIVNHNFQ